MAGATVKEAVVARRGEVRGEKEGEARVDAEVLVMGAVAERVGGVAEGLLHRLER